MALPKPSPGLLPAENYNRFAAAFAAIDSLLSGLTDKVSEAEYQAFVAAANRALADLSSGKVSKAEYQAFATAVNQSIANLSGLVDVGGQLSTAVDTLATQSSAARVDIIGINVNLADIFRRITAVTDRLPKLLDVAPLARPGEAPSGFTTAIAPGQPSTLPIITRAPVNREDGWVYPMYGDDLLAMSRKVRIEAGRTYLVRGVVRREVDPVDPSGDDVRIGLAWFDRAFNLLTGGSAYSLVQDLTELQISDGRTQVTGYISTVSGDASTIIAPAGARYASAYVQTFGSSHRTNVELLYIVDVTDAVRFAPDVSALLAGLAALTSEHLPDRVDVLEGAVGSPGAVTFTSLAAAASAGSVPDTADTIVTRGYAAADDFGGASYVYSPSPPAGSNAVTIGSRAFVLKTDTPNIAMFGANPSNTPAQNKVALDGAVAWAAAHGLDQIKLPPLLYRTDDVSNPFGVRFVGSGLLLSGDGNAQVKINCSTDGKPLVEGREYRGYFSKQLAARSICILSTYGDSTVAAFGITDPRYHPDAILTSVAYQRGVWNFLCINRGVSGTYTGNLRPQPDDPSGAVGRARFLEDIANPAVGGILIKFMINDPTRGTLADYASNTEGMLQEARAARGVDGLAIFLVTGSSTSDTVRGRDSVWYEQAIPVLRRLARKYQCVFIDVYSPYRDAVNAASWMDTVAPGGEHVHPQEAMNGWIWGDTIANVVFDPFATAANGYTATQEFSADYSAYKTPFELPSGFPYGTSRWDVTAARNLFPFDGVLTVVKSISGACHQTLTPSGAGDANGHVMVRTGDLAGNVWKRWSRQTQPIPMSGTWAAYDASGWGEASVSISADGYVQCHGRVKGGDPTNGQVIGTLPAGYRPPYAMDFQVVTGAGTGGLYVLSDGTIRILGGGSADYISLNGIRFRAA